MEENPKWGKNSPTTRKEFSGRQEYVGRKSLGPERGLAHGTNRKTSSDDVGWGLGDQETKNLCLVKNVSSTETKRKRHRRRGGKRRRCWGLKGD